MLQLLRNFSIYTGVSIITGSISFLLLPLLTSYLSPEDYGLLSIFNASIRFVSACIGLGMSHVLLVDLVNSRNTFGIKLIGFGTVTFSIAILFFLGAFIYSFYSGTFFGIPIHFALLIPLISLLVVYFEFFASIMVFLKQAKNYALYSLSKFGLETLLTIFLIVFLGMNWLGRIASLLISLVVVVVFLFFYLIKEFDLKQKVIELKENIVRLIKEGGGLFFMAISIMIINLSDRFFIEYYEGVSETGIYSVSATIAGIMFMVIGALMKVIRPIIYEYLKTRSILKLNKVGFVYHSLLLLFTISLIVMVPFIYKYLIDNSFQDSQKFSFFLIVGLFFWGGYSFFISYILYYKNHTLNSIIAILAIVLNLVLNHFLINEYATIGAAYATLITYVCMFVISIFFAFKINVNHIQVD